MLDDLIRALQTRQSELNNLGINFRGPLSTLVLFDSYVSDRKTKILVFEKTRKMPFIFVKAARLSASKRQLMQEFDNMQQLWHINLLQNSIPQPLMVFSLKNNVFLVQKFIPGTPLSVLLHRRMHLRPKQVRSDISSAITWLDEFQTATMDSYSEFSGREEVELLIERLNNTYPKMNLSREVINKLRCYADEIKGIFLPIVGSHGDFWPGNFLISDLGVNVTDWEHYRSNGNSFSDLFLFLATYAQLYPWDGWNSSSEQYGFDMSFVPGNWLSSIMNEQIESKFKAMGLPFT